MDKDLQKRLEEAAESYRGYLNKCRKLKGKESYSMDNVIMDMCLDATELGYKEGAEYGYKEAITLAKEWLKEKYHLFDHFDKDEVIADFEADMIKLLEGSK